MVRSDKRKRLVLEWIEARLRSRQQEIEILRRLQTEILQIFEGKAENGEAKVPAARR